MDLTDEQWAVIEPLIPEQERTRNGPGRPWRDARAVLNGVLWILRSGAGGKTSLIVTHRIKLATGAFSSGSMPASSTTCSK